MTFAERLRHYREKANLSQTELSEKIGISFATYNNYETKGYEPKYDILLKLAYALGCSANDLVGYEAPIPEITVFKDLAAWGIEVTDSEKADYYKLKYPRYPDLEAPIKGIMEGYRAALVFKDPDVEKLEAKSRAQYFMIAMMFDDEETRKMLM